MGGGPIGDPTTKPITRTDSGNVGATQDKQPITTPPPPSKPADDPAVTAKTSTALKQQGTETKSQLQISGQLVQQNLNNALPAGAKPQAAVFDGPGMDLKNVVVRNFDKPIEAAAHVMKYENTDPAHASLQFHELVSKHKDDPKYLKEFFGAIGGDKSKELIARSHNFLYISRPNNSKADVDKYTGGVRDAIHTLHKSGDLTSSDVQGIVHAANAQGVDTLAKLSTSISNLPEAENLKKSFAENNMQLYQAYQWNATAKAAYATSAAELMGKTTTEDQLKFMSKLSKENKLDSFVKDATSYQPQSVYEASSTYEGRKAEATQQPTGVANLVNTTYIASHGDARDRSLPINVKELEDLRLNMFQSAADVYSDPKRIPIWSKSTDMKDALSGIFQDDFDKIWKSGLAQNKAVFDDESDNPHRSAIQPKLEGFFQHALFSEPTGQYRDETSKFLAGKMNGWMADINDSKMSKQAFSAKYGMERTQLTHIMGETMGFVNNGMQTAVKSAKDRKASNEAGLKWMMDLGFSLLPGGGIPKKMLGIEGAETISKIVAGVHGKAKDALKDMTKDEAVKYLLKEYPGLRADKVMEELFQELREAAPGGDGHDLLSALQSSYTHVDLHPKIPGGV